MTPLPWLCRAARGAALRAEPSHNPSKLRGCVAFVEPVTEFGAGDTQASVTRLLGRMPAAAPDLASLYDAHARRVWRTLLRLGVPPAAVEDAVQDVFLAAQRRLATFRGESEPSTWLTGIAVRVAANARRLTGRRGPAVAFDDALADPASGPDHQLEQRRRLEALQRVLNLLPEEQRDVLVLIDLEQFTAPEVASALGLNVNTVSSRLRLGRAALSKALSGAGLEVAP